MVSIVYVSNAGSSKRYAEMLAEKTGYPCYAYADSNDAVGTEVIFISWVMAGAVQGISEARVKFGTLKAVVAVGMMKSESQDASLKEKNNVSETFFSLAGSFDIKKLSGMYKMMMGMMMKMLKAKLKESDEPKAKEMVDKFEEGFDFVSEENLGELVEFLSK
jgi:hypothetical protein